MINVHDKLIREELPLIGSDAFSLLFAIASHIGKRKKVAWPDIERLRKMCPVELAGELRPMPRERAYAGVNRLISRGIVIRSQERTENGLFGKRVFMPTTKYINIWMGATNSERLGRNTENRNTENRNTENRNTDSRYTEKQQTEVINKVEVVINKREVINKGEERGSPLSEEQKPEISDTPQWVACQEHIIGQLKGSHANLLRGARERTKYQGPMTDVIGDYCRSIAEGRIEGKGSYHLMPPAKEGDHWTWLGGMMAGIERYMKASVRLQNKNARSSYPNKAQDAPRYTPPPGSNKGRQSPAGREQYDLSELEGYLEKIGVGVSKPGVK